MSGAREAIDFLMTANSLEGVKRTGFVTNGIDDPEDVAAHCFGVAAAALLIADRVGAEVDRGRMLTMAVLHDIGESVVGDIALIVKTGADDEREAAAARKLLEDLPGRYREVYDEYEARTTLESRIVKAADKLQMMAKVLAYETRGRGDLKAFWANPRNFEDAGVPAAAELFAELRRRRDEL